VPDFYFKFGGIEATEWINRWIDWFTTDLPAETSHAAQMIENIGLRGLAALSPSYRTGSTTKKKKVKGYA